MSYYEPKGLIHKLEKKFGKHTITNLTLYLIIGYVIGYVLDLISPQLVSYLTLDPYSILHGQIWRLFTWVITAPSKLDFFTIIMLFFYYSIGTSLEQVWGSFRYNLYIFGGIFFTILGAFAAYFMMVVLHIGMPAGYPELNIAVGYVIGQQVSTYYLCMSIFLAFAATFPEQEVMFYFVIPLKVKWLGIVYTVIMIYGLIRGTVVTNTILIASLLNFVVFFLLTRNYNRISPQQRSNRNRMKKAAQTKMHYEDGAMHKCYICGRTDKTNPELVFRYCSKCNGNYEYCEQHLFTHEHMK